MSSTGTYITIGVCIIIAYVIVFLRIWREAKKHKKFVKNFRINQKVKVDGEITFYIAEIKKDKKGNIQEVMLKSQVEIDSDDFCKIKRKKICIFRGIPEKCSETGRSCKNSHAKGPPD